MESRTKHMILGGLLGTVLFGPGGAVLGAAMGQRIYDSRNNDDPPFEGEHTSNRSA